jgi:hypothetical protein
MKPIEKIGEPKSPVAREQSPIIEGMPHNTSFDESDDSVIIDRSRIGPKALVVRRKTIDQLIYDKPTSTNPKAFLPSPPPASIGRSGEETPLELRTKRSKHKKHVNNDNATVLDQPAEHPTTEITTPVHKEARSLDALLEALPKSATFQELSPMLADVSREFRQQVAAQLEPALNTHIHDSARFPHDDLAGKKAICDFVETTLEPLGLAVKVPNTEGLPGKLKATSGNWTDKGSFYFEAYIDGKRKTPSWSETLPELQLVDATPSQSVETQWQKSVGPKANRKGRKLS